MNSKCVRWEDLPPELLAIIHGNLQDIADLVRFRWVCRSWRISASPLPNNISPFFPLKLPHPDIAHRNLKINASAVYLLRLHRDPSKAWMVSVQESVAGNLVLRHALTYAEIPIPDRGNLFDLSPDDWILTQVARSYSHNEICKRCNGIQSVRKVVTIITNSCRGGSIQLVIKERPLFFVLELSGEARKIRWDYVSIRYADFVNFKGWVYTIDDTGKFYLVDHQKSRLIPVAQISDLYAGYNNPHLKPSFRMWFVVSDRDLYVVVTYDYSSFWVFRLVIKDRTDGMITRGKWKRVMDLGDRVFFLANNCSFSVSARDLPHPWEGNCIVVDVNGGVGDVHYCCYPSPEGEGTVFFLKGQRRRRLRSMSSLQGYSDLFNPPSSWSDYA